MKLTLSIITVNFNNKEGLRRTLKSIQSQSYKDYEHIIIDAGSTDGSKEIIIKYGKDSSQLTYWVSEPDNGIYDGMNKGIAHAKGEYIYFLNSGDYLANKDVLSSITFDGIQLICGNMNIEHTDMEYEKILPPDTLNTIFLLKSFLPHPATFIHHTLFRKKKYRTDYRIISDWIHMVESFTFEECSYKHINILVSIFDNTGLSSQNGNLGQTERDKWIKEHISIPIYNNLIELDEIKRSELGKLIPKILQKKARTQRRIKKLVLLLMKVFK